MRKVRWVRVTSNDWEVETLPTFVLFFYLLNMFHAFQRQSPKVICHSQLTNRVTLQLCTSCWCETVFLLEAAAFWAAAMVCVAAAAACFAASCWGHTNGNRLG